MSLFNETLVRKPIVFLSLLLLLLAARCGPASSTPTAVPPTSSSGPAATVQPTRPTPVPRPGVDVPVLMYHKVDTTAYTEWWIPADLFARQMDALKAYGYQTITLKEYLDYRDGLSQLPERPVVLTFDDGYADFSSHALPILQERGMVATLFIPTGLIGETEQGRTNNAWDPPEAIYPANHLVWKPELEALHRQGFEIGAHTISHPHLSELPGSGARREIAEPRQVIGERLGSPADLFSYPFGDGASDPTIRGYVQQAGYRAAVAAYPDGIANTGRSDIWALPRMVIYPVNTLDLDLAHPENLFMRRVDPRFPVPIIMIQGVGFLHEDGTPGDRFRRGDTVTVVVTATNRGEAAQVRVTLELDDDGGPGTTGYLSTTLATGMERGETERLLFTVTLPPGVAAGPQEYALTFGDEYGVLRFRYSDWQPAFLAD